MLSESYYNRMNYEYFPDFSIPGVYIINGGF
jgi:hypothetical protein